MDVESQKRKKQEGIKQIMALPKGSLGKYTPPTKISSLRCTIISILYILFSIGMGYKAGLQPGNDWRYFSWHPFCMTCGMIGLSGIGAVIKKVGGYTATKLHGIVAWIGIMVSFTGMYVIYTNKERYGKKHLQSTHAIIGLCLMISCIGLGMVGGIVLHPDFGVDKTNKTIRTVHKLSARLVLLCTWANCIIGLQQMGVKMDILLMFGIPLIMFIPFSLL